MDIHNTRRPLDAKAVTVDRALGQHPEVHAPAAVSGQLQAPAATPHITLSSLLLDFLQLLERKLPSEAKALLIGVAKHLRAEAGPSAASSNAWADRFERAADSGELTSWLPSTPPPAHFGLRAYQAAAPVEPDLAGLDSALSQALRAGTSADGAAAASGKLAADADTAGHAASDDVARQAELARRPDLVLTAEPRVRRRSKRRRSQRKRSHRRWKRGTTS